MQTRRTYPSQLRLDLALGVSLLDIKSESIVSAKVQNSYLNAKNISVLASTDTNISKNETAGVSASTGVAASGSHAKSYSVVPLKLKRWLLNSRLIRPLTSKGEPLSFQQRGITRQCSSLWWGIRTDSYRGNGSRSLWR